MNIALNRAEQILTVSLEGRLDAATAPALEDELKANLSGVHELILNLESLDYLSSAGLRVLLSAHKAMNKNKGIMRIINSNDAVKDIFEVTGFSEILNIL